MQRKAHHAQKMGERIFLTVAVAFGIVLPLGLIMMVGLVVIRWPRARPPLSRPRWRPRRFLQSSATSAFPSRGRRGTPARGDYPRRGALPGTLKITDTSDVIAIPAIPVCSRLDG